MKLKTIEGTVALVTGSNRGIGRALTEELLERGAKKVYATARRPEQLDELVKRHRERIVPLAMDVTDPRSVESVAQRSGDVQLLFNNAGVAGAAGLLAVEATSTLRQEIEVNVVGTLNVTRAYADVLRSNGGGAVINIVSIAGLVNFPLFPTYSVSKAAAHSLTQALRLQLAAGGTQVIGVYPGPVDTDMAAGVPFEKSSPQEVAAAVLDGLLEGQSTIYPDPMARQFGTGWEASPRAAELGVAQMASSAA